jgi:polar amino acid transport system substrate-binding protein
MLRTAVSSSARLLVSLALATSVAWAQTPPAAAPAPDKPTPQLASPAPTPGQPPAATPAKTGPEVESIVTEEVSPRVLNPALNDTLRSIRSRGVMRACVALSAPWVISDGEQSLTGYSVDVARQLGEDLNADVHFVLSAIPDMIDRLHRGECDIIPGGFGPTPQRALFAHFSTPTTVLDISVVGKKDSMGAWSKDGALAQAGVSIGVIDGTADAEAAKRVFPKAKVEPFAETPDLVKALTDGKVTAVVVSSPMTEFLVERSADAFARLPEPIGTQREGLVVRRGDLEFLAYLNTWVQARTDDLWLATHVRRWFKESDRAAAK